MQELATMEFMNAEDFKKEAMRMLQKACPAALDMEDEDRFINSSRLDELCEMI